MPMQFVLQQLRVLVNKGLIEKGKRKSHSAIWAEKERAVIEG